MLGWMFGGFVKKLEVAAKGVSQDFVKESSKEIGYLFDNKLFPLADKIDYIAEQRIGQVEELESKVKVDIEHLLDVADDKTKGILQEINQVREEALKDLRKTVEQTDTYLENRINQVSLAVMQSLSSAQAIANTTLLEINSLEEKLFQDANQIIDKLDEVMDGKIEMIRNELRKHLAHALPNPMDKCRQRLNIKFKPGALLSDIELYELNECYELSKLNENTSIDEVLKTYGQLQQNAVMMAALVKKAPELKRRAIYDWLKYGVLCEFWRYTMKVYDAPATVILESGESQKVISVGDE